ncbi:DoxX family membrane protein [Echinicola sp. CAU 1574]|uniref:DoxX family membrane protein n=1 Tax=Echinicola arenosa TaxID=2774144 RepID=A0ABR9AEJ4_9BACT|nr:MauE/DoxX family redox-associated membrane protein [Echinicola arenosa]MBD8487167.1 DoxX family membrane protein [Echinicola arenosa]
MVKEIIHRREMAFTLARLPIGFSFLGHGIVRLPKLTAFAEGMAQAFDMTWLPDFLVRAFASVLPFVELLLGLTILLGLWVRFTSAFGVLLVCLLIFGSSLLENWDGVSIQLFYGLYLTGLYLFHDYNSNIFSINKH